MDLRRRAGGSFAKEGHDTESKFPVDLDAVGRFQRMNHNEMPARWPKRRHHV